MDHPTDPNLRRCLEDPAGGLAWQGVERLAYKEDGGASFRAITRQTLFSRPDLACELRYFEIAPGGFSTLERHQHTHAVMILRGSGRVLVGSSVRPVGLRDLVTIPPLAWHQFRADAGQALGFVCMVDARRDRPQLPLAAELAGLRACPEVAAFLDGTGTT